jgi:hypothetical protein
LAFSVSDLRSNLQLGGARSTLFDVNLTMPDAVPNGTNASRKLAFTCEATEIPASDIGVIKLPYFGRMINYAGDRQFQPWRVTVINDEDHIVKDALETWHSLINTRFTNVRATSSANPNLYKTQATITHYGKVGDVIRKYNLFGLWPSEISAIELGWGRQDEIERIGATFQYDWFEIDGPTGTGGPI